MLTEMETYPQNDTLKFLRIVYVEFLQRRFVQFIMCLLLIIYVLTDLIQSYKFLIVFKSEYFVKFAPTYFTTYIIIVGIIGTLTKTHTVPEYMNNVGLVKISNFSQRTQNRIKFESKVITILVCINSVVNFMGGISFVIPHADDENSTPIFAIAQEFCPQWYSHISFILRVQFLLIFLITPANIYQIIYVISHTKFQGIILHQFTRDFLKDQPYFVEDDLDLVEHEQYQREVKMKLSMILERCATISRTANASSKVVRVYIILYAIAAALAGVSILFMMLSFEVDKFDLVYIRLGFFMLSGIGAGASVITIGQTAEDYSEKTFFEYSSLKWYTFNKENRQIFLTGLAQIIKPIRIACTQNICINYDLGMEITKRVYSIFSVTRQLVGRNDLK